MVCMSRWEWAFSKPGCIAADTEWDSISAEMHKSPCFYQHQGPFASPRWHHGGHRKPSLWQPTLMNAGKFYHSTRSWVPLHRGTLCTSRDLLSGAACSSLLCGHENAFHRVPSVGSITQGLDPPSSEILSRVCMRPWLSQGLSVAGTLRQTHPWKMQDFSKGHCGLWDSLMALPRLTATE